jgi:hypothetical protein
MAFSSTFYDTSASEPDSLVTEVKWAQAHPYIGSSQYGVQDPGDFKVTANTGASFTVKVAPGSAWGHGVFDVSDTLINKTASAPATGTTRWDLVALRRDWTPSTGGPSSIVLIEGGATKEIPDDRVNNPGTMDDQPLALVQWTAGNPVATAIIDLRVWGGDGGMYAADDLVRSYLDRVGTHVTIGQIRWSLLLGLTGIKGWVRDGEIGKIPLYGATSASLVGPNPASLLTGGTQFLVQAGTSVMTSDGAGYSRVTFQKPFPNGLLTVITTNGDSSIDRARGKQFTMPISGIPWDNGRLNDFVYVVQGENGVNYGNQLHRVNWIAIGW